MPDNTIFDDVFRTMLRENAVSGSAVDQWSISHFLSRGCRNYSASEWIHGREWKDHNGFLSGNRWKAVSYWMSESGWYDYGNPDDWIWFCDSSAICPEKGRRYQLEFPRSCVLYLRSSRNTPDFLEADVIFPDGKTHLYQIPTIKMKNYTSSTIFEKKFINVVAILYYEIWKISPWYEWETGVISGNAEWIRRNQA